MSSKNRARQFLKLRNVVLIIGMLIVALAHFSPLLAGEPVGDAFVVAEGGGLPAVATLPGQDRFLVVWDTERVSQDGSSLRAKFVDSRGTTIEAEFAATSPGGVQHIPAATANPSANEYLITWWDFRARQGDIYGQRISADGALLGQDFLIAQAANFENWPPAVAFNATANEYLVVWYEDRGEPGQSNIYGRRVSAAGLPLGQVFLVANEGLQVRPAVAVDNQSGAYLVTWSRLEPATIFGQRLNSQAGRVSGPFRVTRGDKPAVTYNAADDHFLVVSANGFMHGARVLADGTVIDGIALSPRGTSKQFSDVAADAAGNALAVWEGRGSSPDDTLIYGSELPPGALTWGWFGVFSLQPAGSHISYPAVAYNTHSNRYLVVWDERRPEQAIRVWGHFFAADEAPPQPPSTLANGDFEAGFYLLEGRSIPNGWASYVVGGQPSFAGEQATVFNGAWAYKISGFAPFTAGLAQEVAAMPGQRYRVTAHYHLYPPGDGQAFLGLKEPEGPYFWAGDSHPGVWGTLSQELTVSSDRLLITLQGSSGSLPNTNVYFDSVTVEVIK